MSLVKIRFLSQTIQVSSQTRDSDGAYTSGANVAHKGRFVHKAEEIKKPDGEVVNSKGVVYIDSTWTPDLSDKFTMPDSTTPRLIMFEEVYNQRTEADHYKVWVQ